jgi:thymidylate synthase
VSEILEKLSPKAKQTIELARKKKFVSNTVELPAVILRFKDITEESFNELFDLIGFNIKQAWEIASAVLELRATNGQIGNYILSDYAQLWFNADKLRNIVRTYPDADEIITTRQLSITFDQMHCFQFINFMQRNDKSYINVGMRSCDFYNNFITDMYLAYVAGRKVLYYKQKFDMNFLIGSLHVYKEDLQEFTKVVGKYVV